MRNQSLLLAFLLITPFQALAYDEFQPGYASERKCFKTEYREIYVPGTESSPGYVNSFKDETSVPCESSGVRAVRRYHHYKPFWHRRLNSGYVIHGHRYASEPVRRNYGYHIRRNRYDSQEVATSCNNTNKTTGGLLGGGLAAALSKKDAYGWSIPLGAVLGMGLATTDC